MRSEGVMGHELLGDLFGKHGIKAATDIDRCQFGMLTALVGPEFRALSFKVRPFGVCL
jgi:hypothetical protein